MRWIKKRLHFSYFVFAGPFAEANTYNSNNNNHNSNHNNDNSKNSSNSYNNVELNGFSGNVLASFSSSVAAMLPQAEATNNTFKSLPFLASEDNSFAYSQKPDGFAETELAHSLPIFDFGMPRNITGRTGHTEAIIKCRVDMLNDKSVSWIRKRDLHILTVGTATYTSDKRFQVTESKDMREWTLHVKSPKPKDSGIYECQVNTEPKISMAFQLNIIEISPDAKAVINGPPDLHFKAGSAIILSCVVKQPSVKEIGPIYWYRGEQLITPLEEDGNEVEMPKDLQPGQLNQSLNEVLSTDLQKEFVTRIAMESQLGDTLKSRLRISNAQITDTGIYTCQPTTANSASVVVHVINDENPAAMQKSAATSSFGMDLHQLLGRIVYSMLARHSTKYWLPNGSSSN
ncbi:GH25011 [Drosophila grimshawi]|uniref:GH25011 n=1 Tax=Drosophila grimshawi TaxID=7222 RepID=B4JZA7_DROGR|nr:GH25011 [Drosophila grimshawi]